MNAREGATTSIPLSAEDRAILELESDTIAGHTCKVIVLAAGAPGADELRELIAGRLATAPALTRRLGGSPRTPAWVDDPDFDLAEHVVQATPSEPLDDRALCSAVGELFAQHLDRSRPLWRLDVLRLQDGGAAYAWRIHHAVADGTTTMRFARQLLFETDAGSELPSRRAAPRQVANDDARRRGHLAGFLRREFARSEGPSPFDAQIGTTRQIGFAELPLRALHDAAKSLAGATVNDAVLACVAGSLRRWIELHHGPLTELRVKVPVSLHHEGDDPGNRDSFFELALPLTEPDPVERLRAIRAATAERKADRDAQEMDELLRELAVASPRMKQLVSKLQRSPRRFALNVSNVPGPRAPVSVLGAPVRGLHSIAEIGKHHALRVSVVSCADTLHFGFCADPAIVHDLDAMVTGAEEEAAALIERSGAGIRGPSGPG